MQKPRFPSPDHDHDACFNRSLKRARATYEERGARLTALRETVLRELARSHEALGAYDIIHRLGARGRSVAPVSVYRALDSLVEAGLIHRLESRNAFVACHATHGAARPILFLVCERCGTVAEAETPDLSRALGASAEAAGFALSDTVLEASGLCAHCTG